MNTPSLDYVRDTGPEPHLARTRALLKAHPEVKELFGPYPPTALITLGIVALQFAIAWALGHYQAPWWITLVVAYVVGAVANHALLMIFHEATHNLVFRGSNANRWIGIFANFPSIIPSALAFRKYHLIHHRHQGELGMDADMPGPKEAAWVGNSSLRKALWLLFFIVVEGVIRPARLKKVPLIDGWILTNLAVQIGVTAATIHFLGWTAILYFLLSLAFSIGLHPLGARWIQEHFVFREGQETYSYYGPANKLILNTGYHNEHHDLMMIAWPKLPKLKAMAPEFYDTLYSHRSYTKLLFRFLFDPKLSLYSRVVRPDREAESEKTAQANRLAQRGALGST